MGQFFILRSRGQQEYNGLLVNALSRIFKSNLSLNNFKWLLTKVELWCVRNIIPRSRKRLWNGYPVLNKKLQNHDPFGRHIPVMYGSTPPPHPGGGSNGVQYLAWQILVALEKTCWHIADTKLAHGKNMWQKSYKLYISSTCLSPFRIPVVIDTERFFLGGTIMGTISRTAFSGCFLLSLLLIHVASRPHVNSNAAAVKTDAPIIGSLV